MIIKAHNLIQTLAAKQWQMALGKWQMLYNGKWFHSSPMTENDLLKRTKTFALRIIRLVKALPNDVAGRAIGNQLIRSGTSVAANYRAACCGRSRAEFIAKLGIVEEASDESTLWLELIIESGLMEKHLAEDLLRESRELTRIMAASRISARRKLKIKKL